MRGEQVASINLTSAAAICPVKEAAYADGFAATPIYQIGHRPCQAAAWHISGVYRRFKPAGEELAQAYASHGGQFRRSIDN